MRPTGTNAVIACTRRVSDGFGSVIVVTMYAGVVGAVIGAVLAWLYNIVMGRGAVAAA